MRPDAPTVDGRTILHVDMDAFYVSVELRKRPDLRGQPVVVGGTGSRGVIAAASYEARRFGLHSAMPSTRARRLCPHVVFLPGDHELYAQVSAEVHEIFQSVTPFIEPLALDEAFLDVTGALRLFGSGVQIAHHVRDQVWRQLQLRCSVGVAPSKFLAKLASVAAKPRATPQGVVEGAGVWEVRPGEELSFLHPLAVKSLWGVGPATLAKLERLGIATVGDLAGTPYPALASSLGKGAATHLQDLANGRDDRAVVPDQEPKSISHEETFATDLTSLEQLRAEVVRLSDAVAARLRHHGYRGRTVQLKVRYRDFSTITRSTTLQGGTDRGTEVLATAWGMLEQLPVERGVRLVGVGVSNLGRGAAPEQLSFDAPDEDGWDAANEVVDAIRDRFGDRLIRPARLAGRPDRSAAAPWGPDAPAGEGAPALPGTENPTGDRPGRG